MKTTLMALAFAFAWACNAHAQVDADALGRQEGYPVATNVFSSLGEKYRVGTFSNMASTLPHRLVRSSGSAAPLTKSAAAPAVTYQYAGGRRTLEDYLRQNRVTGLLVLRGNEILFEDYQYDRKPEQLFTSQSMAKSVVSLAVGKALEDGFIHSLDDPAALYVPTLKDHPYGETSIRHLLRMSSGVRFSENYDGMSDIQFLVATTFMAGLENALNNYRVREVAPGTRFQYASIETAVLGLVVRGATGKHLADYVSERIWKPLGAEADAAWIVDPKGVEVGFAYFNARLRDYGRLGAMLANDGAWNGNQIISASYLKEASTSHDAPEAGSAANGPGQMGYGYQFWTLPGPGRQFALRGLFSQVILVHPAKRLVLVQTAVSRASLLTGPAGIWNELALVWAALVDATPDAVPK